VSGFPQMFAKGLSAYVDILGCNFKKCRAGSGGAVSVDAETVGSVDTSEFADNLAADSGGAVIVSHSRFLVEGTRFTGNQAVRFGGAMAVITQSSVTVYDSNFSQNVADEGGGVAIIESTVTLQGSHFQENVANGAGGAGLRSSRSYVDLIGNVFFANMAPGGGGGGILWDGESPLMRTVCDLGWIHQDVEVVKNSRSQCVPCPAGSYKNDLDEARCIPCDAGGLSPC